MLAFIAPPVYQKQAACHWYVACSSSLRDNMRKPPTNKFNSLDFSLRILLLTCVTFGLAPVRLLQGQYRPKVDLDQQFQHVLRVTAPLFSGEEARKARYSELRGGT